MDRRRWRWILLARTIAVVALITLLFVLLRGVYFAMYHEPRSVAISRDLNALYAGDGDNDASSGGDIVAKRERLQRLRRRMGVGLDSLPTVRFDSSSDEITRKKRRISNDSSSNENAVMLTRQKECLTFGSYVSPVNEFVDCRTYCNVPDGVEYRYYDRLGLLLNGRKGQVGGYCMPTDAAVCNPNTSLAVYGKDKWRCLPQTRAFAGEGGNLIVACNGSLLDRATGKIWREHIDPSLAFDSVDEFLPGTKKYRFVCPPQRDDRDNARIEAPFDRLFLLRNICAALIPHADESIRPNFEEQRCECGHYAVYDENLGTCVPKDSNQQSNDIFNSRTLESILIMPYSGPCWEPWMTLSQARQLPEARNLCGVEHFNAGDGAANSAFVRTRAHLFDRAVPSPTAMLISAASIHKQ